MRYEKCPACDGKLGIPNKMLGHPVTCPKCKNVFLLPTDAAESSESSSPKKKRKKKSRDSASKPSVRALPTPAALISPGHDDDRIDSDWSDSRTDERSGLNTPAPKRKNRSTVESRSESDVDLLDSDEDLDVHQQAAVDVSEVNGSDLNPSPPTNHEDQETADQMATARIIQVDEQLAEMDHEGELPTLQLTEDHREKITGAEIKTSPIFLGILICVSVVTSGLLLVFGDFQSTRNQKTVDEARQELQKFYYVRQDVELKPYQMELREAQLAHSRGDRRAEVEAYRKVLVRFRAEDKSKFVGVTGSPTADQELQELVSIVLGADVRGGFVP